jgi:D-glycero-alpha-D-manno-heptose-7-phosphate kinase
MIISRTPVRISLIGGGSDIIRKSMKIPGSVISTTIDKFVYVIIKKKFDNIFRISYFKNENVKKIDDIKHDHIRETLKFKKIKDALEIITVADIPSSGSGLGSSSALTVGLINALNCYLGIRQSSYQVAKDAYYIEKNILKKKIGYQDHFNAAFGGFRKYIFYKNNKVSNYKVLNLFKKKKLLQNIMIFYTGINRSADKILNKINKNQNNILIDDLSRLCSDFEIELNKGNYKVCGEILDISWNIKKKLSFGISNKFIDSIYKKGKLAGAYGGKILGAGGGGYFIFLCKKSKQKNLKNKLNYLTNIKFNFEDNGSRIIFND